ncbi:stage 0 sporulation family protein [Nonomuraea salmonea]|uniref:PSP1 domain-containing protein n=1 Tax=Nonomuraea salmonea TaxID=46181 RepID=UPI003618DDAF
MSFTRYGRLYYLDPGEHTYKVGDKVLVPTDSGPEVAECVWAPQYTSEDVEGLPVCAGPAGEEHLSRDESNKRRRAEARSVSKRLIKRHSLPMKVVGIDYLDEDNVYTVYFSAPHRVDFRALVRDLARNLRARVELRQIGPRDEARLQGGIGPCGRDLCCATFLKDFEPVSVRMAKDQDLPVNPLRIAGRAAG